MRPRLVALILLPTAAAVLLTGLQLTTALSTANEYRRMTEVASLVESLGTLSHEMAEERDLTAWWIALTNRTNLGKVTEQREVVDRSSAQALAAMDALDASQATRVRTEVAQIRRWLNGLPGLRRLMTEGSVLPRAALGMYTRMITDFTTLHDDLGRSGGDERLIGDALALGALTRAKEQVARQRGTLLVSFLDRKFDFDDPADLLGAYRSQLAEENSFRATASANDIKAFRDAVNGPKVDQADSMRALVMSLMRENKPLERIGRGWLISATNWYGASTSIVDGMRTVERRLASAVVSRSQEMESAEQRSAVISGASILVLLVLILLITAWVAGTLVRPLRRLRSEALEVADTRLPETVRVLRESGDQAPQIEVPSIGVVSRDEIGEVARAFDEVHREAIRLAGDEARLRSNINAMFVNLSRRTQSLVERQIDLIDDLEQGEQDEGRLGSLFKLDHLATRMRRNSENLLVLAGQEQSRRWSEPVPLSDVVRASLSEVENYERVNLRVESGISIIGQAVNDIVHLIAELVENAIFFSPQDTKITVTSNGNEMGAVILAVTDSGIGMNDEELAEANRRLAEPPAVDLSVSRRMGLFVVGRLAMRHGIRVQLRRPEAGGLSAVVLLPVQVVAQSTMMPELALSGQSMPSGSFGGQSNSFGSMSIQDPFASVNPDPFGSAPNPDPFGTGAGRGGRPQAGLGTPPAQAPPQVPAPTSGDLWSGPVVPASAVEDLWSSPLASTAPPSFPSAWPDPPAIDPWTPHRLEPVESTQALPVVEVPPTEPEPEEFLPIFAAVGSDWFRSGASAAPEPEQEVAPEPEPEPVAEVRPRPLEQRVRRGPQGLETQNIPQITHSSPPSQQQQPRPPQQQAPPLPQRAPQQQQQQQQQQQAQPLRPAEPAAERQPWSTPSDQGWAAAEVAKKPVEGGVTGAGLPKRVPKANLVPGAASAAPAAPAPPMPPISAERVRSRLSSFQQGVRQGRAEMSERANAVEGENQQ
ncbi:nitrate- and nitrite sensing domain-containing protein [Streptosporangium sp. NBC_01495]|uniref:sensor histidine kinase n=1 Tax=Streptosporangium sp. NBC_01495 TaxID=2903899 RepID=UPI002E34ACE9|nr:nitrate- and nitrite sensing domain-containing protein [Streptosporangium sp. NBC_01495]